MSPFFMFCFLLFFSRCSGDHFIIEHTPALFRLYKNYKALEDVLVRSWVTSETV
jgi:hypothetical protein